MGDAAKEAIELREVYHETNKDWMLNRFLQLSMLIIYHLSISLRILCIINDQSILEFDIISYLNWLKKILFDSSILHRLIILLISLRSPSTRNLCSATVKM